MNKLSVTVIDKKRNEIKLYDSLISK